MSLETFGVLRSNGRLHATTNYVSLDVRARLRRSIRQARREGAAWQDIASAAVLGVSTVKRLG